MQSSLLAQVRVAEADAMQKVRLLNEVRQSHPIATKLAEEWGLLCALPCSCIFLLSALESFVNQCQKYCLQHTHISKT